MIDKIKKILDVYFSIIRRYIPSKPVQTAIGIDIGAKEVKLIEIGKEGNDFGLLNWDIEPIEGGNVLEAVKASLRKIGKEGVVPFTAVSGKGTLIRYVDMPRMADQELKNSFAIEADKYFPFPLDQIYTDCYILNPEGKGKQMKVLVAAAKKELIDARVKLLTELGGQPGFVGIDPVALANVIFVLGGIEDEADTMGILDIGETVSNLTILKNRVPQFTRDIFIGGQHITKRISTMLGVDMAEAERLKQNPDEKAQQIKESSEAIGVNMVQELRLSLDYFSTENGGDVKKLLITGGGAMLSDLLEQLNEQLGLEAQRWNPLEKLKIPENAASEELKVKSHQLGVALGLALYHYA